MMGENHTVIGEQGAVRGTIHGAEDVVVFGYVEGRVELEGTFFVEPPGIVKANVEARHVVVAGVVVGDIRARDCIEILPTGRIVGNLSTPRLVMAAGGAVRGRVSMEVIAAGAEARTTTQAAAAPPLAAPPHRPATHPRLETRDAPSAEHSSMRAAAEPVWRRPTLQMAAVREEPPAPVRPPSVEAAPVQAAPVQAAPPSPEPVAPAPVEPPPPMTAPASGSSRVLPAADRPFQPPRGPRRSFEDLDSLFPVIPESSMDGWAVSVRTPGTPDDGSGSRET